MSPEYVQPYVKSQKTDDRDAGAIAEAATRPTMRDASPRGWRRRDAPPEGRRRPRRREAADANSLAAANLLIEAPRGWGSVEAAIVLH
jgi:hypothetical protein